MDELTIPLSEITDGGCVRKTIGSREVAIFRKGEEVYAIDATCPHRRGPLDGGELEDGYIVVCPWHGWRFDIRTGKSPTDPGQVLCHHAAVEGADVRVKVNR